MKRSQLDCPEVAATKPTMCVHLLDLTDTPGYSDPAVCYAPAAHGTPPGAVFLSVDVRQYTAAFCLL